MEFKIFSGTDMANLIDILVRNGCICNVHTELINNELCYVISAVQSSNLKSKTILNEAVEDGPSRNKK